MTDATLAPEETRTALPDSPYKGLLPYNEADAGFFFGRETEQELIVSNLLAARLTLLYGPSGVGKSSVLYAGVARRIHTVAQEALEDEDRPRIGLVIFKEWHDDAVEALGQAARRAVETVLPNTELADPPADATLADVLQHWSSELGGRLLIVLDQFEEYFLYAKPGDRFVEELPQALSRGEVRANILLSIREDALARLDVFKGRIPYLFDNYLRIDRLDLEAGERAIKKPLGRWNELGGEAVEAEQDLVDAVLAEVRPDLSFGQYGEGTAKNAERAERIETTFLQLVMTRLWGERRPGDPTLRLETYVQLGRARGIVRSHVNRGLKGLTDEERDAASETFRHLVTKSGQKVAHNAGDLADLASTNEAVVTNVLEKLAAPGVLILRRVDAAPGREAEGPRYEIYHDTLGEAVLEWRAEHVEAQQTARAAEAAREAVLAEARQRRRRRRRIALGIASVPLAAGILALIWLNVREGNISRSRRLAAEATAVLPTDPEQSLELARRAVLKHRTTEATTALRTALVGSRLRLRLTFGAPVRAAAFTPNGSRVIVTMPNGQVRITPLNGRGRTITLQGDRGWTPAISPDGRRVIVERYGTYVVWDIGGTTARKLSKKLPQTARGINPRFSPDGKSVATTDRGSVVVSNLGTGNARRRFSFRSGLVYDVAFTPKADRLAAGTGAGEAAIFDVRSGAKIPLVGHTDTINSVAISPDGKLVATGSEDSTTRVWQLGTGKLVRVLHDPNGAVSLVRFSPKGRLLLTISPGTARVYEVKTWTTIAIHRDPDYVNAAQFSLDGTRVVTAGRDGTAAVWSATTGGDLFRLAGHSDELNSAEFSSDGTKILTASSDHTARIWDATMGTNLPVTGDLIPSGTFSPDGRWIAVANERGEIQIFDRSTPSERRQLRGGTEAIPQVSFSPDSRRLVASSWDGKARVFDLTRPGQDPLVLSGHTGDVIAAEFGPKGDRVVTSSIDGTARIWTLGAANPSSRIVAVEPSHALLSSAGFSPDGRRIVTASFDGTARVWDANARRPRLVRTIGLHRGGVIDASFSPDGRWILTTSFDKTAMLWDTANTGKAPVVLRGHSSPVWTGNFSADSRRVVTGDSGGTARIWDVASGATLAVLHWSSTSVDSATFDPRSSDVILTTSDDGTAQIGSCVTCGTLDTLLDLAKARTRMMDGGR
jgi:WD40 repeat protein